MNLLCKFLGHSAPAPNTYGIVDKFATDGLGVGHANVAVMCQRCAKPFPLIRIHLPNLKPDPKER